MRTAVAGFEGDRGNAGKCLKHGVSRAEIEGLFARSHTLRVDVEHSLTEERFRAIGEAYSGRFIFLVFTLSASAMEKSTSDRLAPAICPKGDCAR